jgi:hypothetical protein
MHVSWCGAGMSLFHSHNIEKVLYFLLLKRKADNPAIQDTDAYGKNDEDDDDSGIACLSCFCLFACTCVCVCLCVCLSVCLLFPICLFVCQSLRPTSFT